MKIKRIVVGVYSVNCYIVYNSNGDGFIVDPGGDFDDITKFITENNITPKFILLTHGHRDHIGAVNQVKELYNIPVFAPLKEKELLMDSTINLSKSIPPFKPIRLSADRWLNDGEEIDFYENKMKIIDTPGHTSGSISILMDDVIFTGDTLFNMSIGRTDLPTGSIEDMQNSLKKLYKLNDDLKVLPGHGAESIMKYEKENNPFLKKINI